MNEAAPLLTPKVRWILKWAGVLLGLYLCAWILFLNTTTVALLVVSFLFAYLLNPFVDWMSNKGMPRDSAVRIVIIIAVFLIAVFLMIVVGQVYKQAGEILNPPVQDPNYGGEYPLLKWFDTKLYPLLKEYEIVGDRSSVREAIKKTFQWIQTNYPNWLRSVWETFLNTFTGFASYIVWILNLLLVPVFTYYLLRDYNVLQVHFYEALPPHWRVKAADWINELDKVVGGFIRGQFSIALLLMAFYSVGLSLLGVPLGFILGILSGLANMIPYMSVVVGLVPALLLSFVDEPNHWMKLLWITLYFGAGQALEGFYLSPRIMGQETGLHPVLIMVAIIVGGSLMGLTGIVLAVPVAAILKVIATRWHHSWKQGWPDEA
ncbi:MAG: AI-2E family transporter [bacterium]